MVKTIVKNVVVGILQRIATGIPTTIMRNVAKGVVTITLQIIVVSIIQDIEPQ